MHAPEVEPEAEAADMPVPDAPEAEAADVPVPDVPPPMPAASSNGQQSVGASSSHQQLPDDVGNQAALALVEAHVNHEEDAGSPALRRPRGAPAAPKVYKSPAEILEQISPPGLIIRLSFNDHRFKVESSTRIHGLSKDLDPPYNQKSFSRSFIGSSWQESLKEVHKHGWNKYYLMQLDGLLPAADAPQDAGVIGPDILAQLDPEIKKLPPPKKYT